MLNILNILWNKICCDSSNVGLFFCNKSHRKIAQTKKSKTFSLFYNDERALETPFCFLYIERNFRHL